MRSRETLLVVALALIFVVGFASILAFHDTASWSVVAGGTMVQLFFATPDGAHLVGEVHYAADVSPKRVVELLVKGPMPGSHLVRTLPPGVRVNGVEVRDGVAYVDFSSSLVGLHGGGSTGEIMTVYSIVNTLATLPGINAVKLLLDGNEMETLAGHLDLTVPLTFDRTLLLPLPGDGDGEEGIP